MIKKLIVALLIAVPATLSAQKFGVVDAQSVMAAMPETAEMQAKLDASSKSYQAEFENLQKEFEAKYTKVQQMAENTLPTIRDRAIKEVQELDQKIQQFRITAQQDLQNQEMQLMQPIQTRLVEAIQSVGADGGYTFIFTKEMPVYVGTTVDDVTPDVRKRLGL